ncbi:MAG: diguanylate cyclase [Deltaproteobacteria bacterium]|jgi:diguanylate cyclase (GGDEF)-like protein|nr:diguanylate cyclase [Deltaproteobacteria bacterium]MBT6434801.1 diguanylate cyclase [Deltaproteobacteria bacterium]MBT6492264.1 diguanylate cyclase [Deltaproteobacteria bacterium]
MADSYPLLKFYLKGLRRAKKAKSAILFVPSPSAMSTQSFLVVDGQSADIPELASISRATSFLVNVTRGVFEWQGDPGEHEHQLSHGVYIKSKNESAVVVPLLFGQDAFAMPRFAADGRMTYTGEERRESGDDSAPEYHKSPAWLGLAFEEGQDPSETLTPCADGEFDLNAWLQIFGGVLGRQMVRNDAILHDALTGLPGPAELRQVLDELIIRPNSNTDGFALAFFCPEDFGETTDRYSENVTRGILAEVSQRIVGGVRASDFICRVGHTCFAAIFPGTTEHHAVMVAKRIMQQVSNEVELEDLLPVILKCGLTFNNGERRVSADVLIQEASQALQKTMDGGNKDLARYGDESLMKKHHIDLYHAAVASDCDTDSRRVFMLKEMLGAIAMEPGGAEILKHVSACLQKGLGSHHASILKKEVDGKLEVIHNLNMDSRETHPSLRDSELALIQSALDSNQPRGVDIDGVPGSEVDVAGTALALPLYHRDECTGVLYMQSPQNAWLGLGDVLFLCSATRHLGIIVG